MTTIQFRNKKEAELSKEGIMNSLYYLEELSVYESEELKEIIKLMQEVKIK